MTAETPPAEGAAERTAEEGESPNPTDTVEVDAGGEPSAGIRTPSDEADEPEAAYPAHAPSSDEFGWEGWVLVGVLLVSFLLVPPAIIYLPEAQGVVRSLGLTMRDAYLALPMVPAILLGAVAVWAAVRHRRR
jgi:hypothetical protein